MEFQKMKETVQNYLSSKKGEALTILKGRDDTDVSREMVQMIG